jgi:hypothetical protein
MADFSCILQIEHVVLQIKQILLTIFIIFANKTALS